jgi:hypothetical protein
MSLSPENISLKPADLVALNTLDLGYVTVLNDSQWDSS